MTPAKPIVPPGRLDVLLQEMLKQGVRLHGNPMLRIALKMYEGDVSKALGETFGPETPAGKAALKFLNAAREFEQKFREASAQVRAEDFES